MRWFSVFLTGVLFACGFCTDEAAFAGVNIAAPVSTCVDQTCNDLDRLVDPKHQAQEQGIKSWAVKKALKSISWMIRSGGDEFVRIAGDFLDREAKAAIRTHSDTIADAIDRVAGLPDVAGHVVREKLFYMLSGPLGPGTANVIANAVEGVLWILL